MAVERMAKMNSVLNNNITEETSSVTDTRTDEDVPTVVKLSSLSTSLTENFSNVIQLDLSDSLLEDLPSSLSSMEKLQCLILNNNKLSCLPNAIAGLKCLKILKAHKNKIQEIPENLGELIHLEELDLSSNALSTMPYSCTRLNHLHYLSLAENNLTEIPKCVVCGISDLRILDLSRNRNINLNLPPSSTKLTIFHAKENDLCPVFPTWILAVKYYMLEEVALDFTSFRTYNIIEKPVLSHIKRLSMTQSNLSDPIIERLTAAIAKTEKLLIGNTRLRTGNMFWHMPIQNFKYPLYLKEIDVRGSGIPIIPHAISNFANLIAMDISFNHITWLPNEICELKHLERLIMNNNKLALLPENIGQLASLEELNASCNTLSKVPDSIRNASSLRFLDLYDNEFACMPEAVKELPNLIGLDFEQNYSSTEGVSIRSTDYECLRAALREHWNSEAGRTCGPKSETVSDDLESENCKDDSEDSVSTSFDKNESWNDLLDEENWNVSEDSTDEFDPNEWSQPKMQQYPLFYKPNQRVFCPSDLHQKRTRDRVLQMLRSKTLTWLKYEEGQFEDP